MRRFRFPLQRALSVRVKQADALRVLLAAALSEWRRAQAAQREAQAARQRWQAELSALQRQGLAVSDLLAGLAADRVLAERAAAASRRLEAMAVRLERVRSAFVAARQRAEALEKLRGRRLEAHRAAVLQAEQNELDDLAPSRRGRRDPPGHTPRSARR